jgi:Domain of unknown function (DUF4157)
MQSMQPIRVHSSSPSHAPSALAYAHGMDVHVGPGQEHQVGHEAAHVLQQRQGRVRPSNLLADVPINAGQDH